MSPVVARRAARLVFQTVVPAFPLKGEFTFQGSKFSIETYSRQGALFDFLIIEAVEQGNRCFPDLSVRAGVASHRRKATTVPVPAEHEADFLLVCRLLANASSGLAVYGRKASLKEFNDWVAHYKHWDAQGFEEALTKSGVDLTKLQVSESGFSVRKTFLEFRAFYDTVLTHFTNVRKDDKGQVWRAEYQHDGIPVAWRRVTRMDLGLPAIQNVKNYATLEDFVKHVVMECRRADTALNVWASSYCQNHQSLTRKIVDQVHDGPEVGDYHAQMDLYVFYNEFVTATGWDTMDNVKQPLYPYWFSPEDRPLPTAIRTTAAYKIMTDQSWTYDTMWAFWVHFGIALLRGPTWQPGTTQVTPFLYGRAGTGKSVLLELIAACFLAEHKWVFNPGDSKDFMTEGLKFCRLILWPETRSDSGPGLVLYKQITDNKDVTINAKNITQEQIVYEGAFWLNGNREFWPTPKYKHESGRLNSNFQSEMFEFTSIARRIALFPFYNQVLADDRDEHLEKRVLGELPVYISTALWCVHQALKVPEEFKRHLSSEQMDTHRDQLFRFNFEDEHGQAKVSPSVVDKLPSYNASEKGLFIFAP